jgi:hypothetical protein
MPWSLPSVGLNVKALSGCSGTAFSAYEIQQTSDMDVRIVSQITMIPSTCVVHAIWIQASSCLAEGIAQSDFASFNRYPPSP